MSQIRVDTITDRAGSGSPSFPNGLSINIDGNASGLTGTPDITVRNVVGAAATFSGDVQVQGELTYEDVTNVDAIGIITARSGLEVQSGGVTVTAGGVAVNGGTLSVADGTNLDGYKIEEGSVDGATGLSGLFNYNLEDGHVQKYSSATSALYEPNFRVSSSVTLDSVMDVGDVASATLMVASSSHYLDGANIQIDGSTANLDIDYIGGSAPSAANGSGYDIYSFTIQKTAATPAYHIVVNALGAN